MGWPKGKPRGAKQPLMVAVPDPPRETITVPVAISPVIMEGPAKVVIDAINDLIKLRDEKQKELDELNSQLAQIAAELGTAMPKPLKQAWPVQIEKMMTPEEPQGPPAELASQDRQGEGRWL